MVHGWRRPHGSSWLSPGENQDGAPRVGDRVMGGAAYNRGSCVISREIDGLMPEAHRRADLQAYADERKRLLARIADLETMLRKSNLARVGLRYTLTMEREAHEETKRSAAFSTKCLLGALKRLDPKNWSEG